jgi:hypothetical protein
MENARRGTRGRNAQAEQIALSGLMWLKPTRKKNLV